MTSHTPTAIDCNRSFPEYGGGPEKGHLLHVRSMTSHVSTAHLVLPFGLVDVSVNVGPQAQVGNHIP